MFSWEIGHRSVVRTLALFPFYVVLLLVVVTGCGSVGWQAYDIESEGPLYHRVTSGETLAAIGERYGVSVKALSLLNGIRNPESIASGELLLVAFRGYGEHQRFSPQGEARIKESRVFIPPKNGRLGWPAAAGRVVSTFGKRNGSFHDGIDIAALEGTAVLAAHDGVVAYSDDGLSGYGNLIIVKSNSGMITVYAHNRKNLVSLGDRIRRGDRIALVGATGRASGPHLHFEVRIQDKKSRYLAVDPIPLFEERKGGTEQGLRYRINESLTPIVSKLNPLNWGKK